MINNNDSRQEILMNFYMNQYANTSNQIQKIMDKQEVLTKLVRELNDYQYVLISRQTELLRLLSETLQIPNTSTREPPPSRESPPPTLEIPRPLRNTLPSNATPSTREERPLDYFIYTFLPDRNTVPARTTRTARTSEQSNLTSNLIDTLLDEFLNPVSVPPSRDQIDNSTTALRYGDIDEPLNTSCPISLIPFQNDDNILMINSCRHIYHTNSLMNWFASHANCPLCRVDIRESE